VPEDQSIGKSSHVAYVRLRGPSQLIIRVVKMHFTDAGVAEFLEIFNQNKVAIRNFPGCSHLELLKEAGDDTVFATLSHWDNELSLENYRKSELFASVWGRVKTLFAKPTQAFSFEKIIELP
jgi:heme-degrading monooxygenase HmoA